MNHFHILLEVPPEPESGLPDEELLRRLGALYSTGRVNEVAKELAAWRQRGDEIGNGQLFRYTFPEGFGGRFGDIGGGVLMDDGTVAWVEGVTGIPETGTAVLVPTGLLPLLLWRGRG